MPLKTSRPAALSRLAASLLAPLLIAAPLAAQAPPGTPSQGVPLPDRSLSAQDDAASVEINPAGLGFMQNAELQYNLHRASSDYARTVPDGHAFFGAVGGGGFGLGFGAQFLFRPEIVGAGRSGDYRKYTLAGALGDADTWSLGFAYNFFGSNSSPTLDQMRAWDLGAQLRLNQYLGLGLFARDLNAPFLDPLAEALSPRWGLGAILRLWDGRLQLEQQVEQVRRSEFITLTPRLVFEGVEGLRLFARAAFQVSSGATAADSGLSRVVGGVEVSLGGLGAQAALTVGGEETELTGQSYTLWLANNKKRSVLPGRQRWVVLELGSSFSELPSSGLFSTPSESFVELILQLDQIAADEAVEGLVINVSSPGLGFAQLWEVRQRLEALRAGGKKIVALMQSATTQSVMVASAADKVLMTPNIVYEPNGISAELMNYKELFARFGIRAEFLRVRDYKSSPESFVLDEPSEESLAQTSAYIEAVYTYIIEALAASRAKTPAEIIALLNEPPLLPDEALERGYIDGIIYPDEIDSALKDFYGKRVRLDRTYAPEPTSEERWQRHPEIAILVISGAITQGNSGASPLGGGVLSGSGTILGSIERLASDRNVKAVVVRVDSPGGSALASDQIYRELRRLAQKKPVLTSMGDIAASGGYYVAAASQTIFATPVTLTGSIGIFTGKFSFGELAERYGVTITPIERGARAGTNSIWQPFSETELASISKSLVYLYELFLAQIAHTRDLTIEEIDAVARGRIWSGEAAKAQRLVDEQGGLIETIRQAERLASLRPHQATYTIYPRSGGLLRSAFGPDNALAQWVDPIGEALAAHALRDQAATFEIVRLFSRHVLTEVGPHALLPLLYGDGEAMMLMPMAFDIKP